MAKSISILNPILKLSDWSVTSLNKLVPATVLDIVDSHKLEGVGFNFTIPADFLSDPVIKIIWSSKSSVGGVVLRIQYNAIGGVETVDPSTFNETLSIRSAVTGNRDRAEASFTLAENFASGDEVQIRVIRVTTNTTLERTGDDMVGPMQIFDVVFKYIGV